MKKIMAMMLILLSLGTAVLAQKLLAAVDSKDYKAAEQAIKEGENVNATNAEGMFPLWNAVWNQDAKMVELLLKNGADAKQIFKSNGGIALLDVAAQEGSLEVVTLLVKMGADIHRKDGHGQTPLRVAARNGRTNIVKFLLAQGAEVDTKGNDGATPLEHAASKGHLDIVKLLVEKGANINLQDNEGDFALGEAAGHGFIDVVKYLLDKGADTTLRNAEGYDAGELARLSGQPKIQALLKQKRKS